MCRYDAKIIGVFCKGTYLKAARQTLTCPTDLVDDDLE